MRPSRDTWSARLRTPGGRAGFIAVTVVAATAIWFAFGWGGTTALTWGDDLACALASAVATVCCWRVSRRPATTRVSWQLLAAGAGAWTIGQVIWTVHDLAMGGPTPFPYYDDLGFLAFPVIASIALVRLPTAASERTVMRWGLDGTLVASSALLLLWSTVIEPTGSASDALGGTLVAIAYPLLDVVLLTVTVLAALHLKVGRARMMFVAFSLVWLAVADMLFNYLSARGGYQPGAVCDVAYVGAFAVLAAATFVAPGSPRQRAGVALTESVRTALPYLPFVVAIVATLGRQLAGDQLDNVDVTLGVIAVAAILGRQKLVLSENSRLLATISAQHEELRHSAMTDPLTGLANRAVFTDRVSHATQLHARDMRQVSLAWIDLDDFKLVNDTAGHGAGDQLLVKVAERLRGAARVGDTIARLGGDEFAVLIEDGSDPVALADRICDVLRQPFILDGKAHGITCSVGVTVLNPEDPPLDPAELVSRADVAMYHAKNGGKNRVALHRDGMTVPGADDAPLRDPLRRAIENDEITVCFQPLLHADDGRLRGFEALARWQRDGRPVPPEEFVALAERVGLGCALGDRILDHSIAQAAAWLRDRDDIAFGVNLAPSQILDPELPARLAAILTRHGLPPSRLVLEITEAALLTDSSLAIDNAHQLVEMGIRLSLDDFGTGYSSLAHLRRLPLSSVKIDRSFVGAVDTDEEARAFIAAVIRLGQDLGLEVVVEGIERPEQLAVARELGTTYVQGYLLGAPDEAAAIDLHHDWSPMFADKAPLALPRPRRAVTDALHPAGGTVR
jgi:diguanylate cyclase (GGDEF)-like protein